MKISVIVPSYNAEKYIAETLDCLLAQTLGDIEIIAVNDGSTDSTPDIIDAYAAKDCRVIRVDQPNGGVSSARNNGLERARGEYVLFLDSDDLLSSRALELLCKRLDETGADMAICRLERFGYGGNEYNAFAEKLASCKTVDVYDKLLLWNFLVGNKCYRRERLVRSGVRFPLLRYSEEGAFFMRYVLLTKPIIIGVSGAVMRYRRHTPEAGFSVSQSISEALLADFCAALRLIYDAAAGADIPQNLREGYMQEIIYKTAYILVMQFYRLLWRADAATLSLMKEKYDLLCSMADKSTLAKIKALHKDIGELVFDRDGLARTPIVSVILKNPTAQALGSLYMQSMPRFEVFLPQGCEYGFAGYENLHLLPEQGFAANAKKQAKGAVTVTFAGDKPPSEKTLKVISLLKKSKKFSFFPAPLIKLGAALLIKIRK